MTKAFAGAFKLLAGFHLGAPGVCAAAAGVERRCLPAAARRWPLPYGTGPPPAERCRNFIICFSQDENGIRPAADRNRMVMANAQARADVCEGTAAVDAKAVA